MKFTLRRIAKKEKYTIGKLYIDGIYYCDTLEDKVRPDGEKIYGETAIPHGTYKFIMTYSTRFKMTLPLLLKVPMFDGIRIHAGNTAKDTHGCILVGDNSVIGEVHESRKTLDALLKKIVASGQHSWEIEILNE
jgi:hypothetical protein